MGTSHHHSPPEPLIELKHVYFNYHNNPVLEDISFSVVPGDYIGIIGPNGGGKTTLLNIILGLVEPTKGEVALFGKKSDQLGSERASIGYVPQRLGQLDVNFPATVYEIVCSGRTALHGVLHAFSSEDKEAVEYAMEVAQVSQFKTTLIHNLSGGQRQRVLIARALAGNPKILILDEPTTGVDVASQEQFYAFLAELNHTHGITILFVSHDIDIIANEVHTLLLLNKKVICFGPAKDLINKEYLEQLYGKRINFTFHHH